MTSGVFRLAAGEAGPSQQSAVSCGAACLTVARMMIDPALHAWIVAGDAGPARPRDERPPAQRFAEHERRVLVRTNALRPRGDAWQAPWPTSLGTPPWGALAELEHGASVPGTRYQIGLLRGARGAGLRRSVEHVLGRIAPGAPALLYVGDATLPRHIVLLYSDESHPEATLYDPGDGRADVVPLGPLERGQARLSGWGTAWFVVYPQAHRRVGATRELPGWWPQSVLRSLPAGALARDDSA